MKYVMNIDYEEEPDYDYVRQIFKAALKKNGFTDDGKLAFAAAAARTPKASGTRVNENSFENHQYHIVQH